ncbi:dTDP-4-dehydrorhamnose reductase [Paenibacillus sp. yr247]|uniref:dTDP-4-dehydrorhamnose reductase n=1 Tax=Paenibacillus sp. yr247 TaxID=1761880 RepID=UPI000884C928|nr:dTDP-4-dehydrorhamnose reductase [Paenibacillus sp. yr247]SDN59095.1 dTDP-4-dehydrorhamnose reductase [Paenibacillus sp. yr247]
MMKRIALLGANGQLGSDIRSVFAGNNGYEIIPITREQLNVENTESIIPFLEGLGYIHVLINCTAFHNTEQCERDPLKALMVNTIAVLRMALYCKEHNATMIHFSTDYVFDGIKNSPYTEEDETHPLNVYGSTKVAGEKVMAAYLDHYFIFRISSLYGIAGSSGKGGNFIETMIRLIKQGKPVSVVNDMRMSPTYSLDVAQAVQAFLDGNVIEYGIYHCSGEGDCSWYELAIEAFTLCGLPYDASPILSSAYEAKCQRPSYSVLDNSKINSIYPMPCWKSSLKAYLQEKGYVGNGGESP